MVKIRVLFNNSVYLLGFLTFYSKTSPEQRGGRSTLQQEWKPEILEKPERFTEWISRETRIPDILVMWQTNTKSTSKNPHYSLKTTNMTYSPNILRRIVFWWWRLEWFIWRKNIYLYTFQKKKKEEKKPRLFYAMHCCLYF